MQATGIPPLQAIECDFSPTPRAISCYSVVDGVVEYNTATALRRFVGPPDNMDLNVGISSGIDLSPTPHRLDSVIEACMRSHGKFPLLTADVITRRGTLISLSCAEGKNAEYNLSFIDGRLFIEQYFTDEPSPTLLAGFSFEQKCTTSDSDPFQKGAYYSVVSRKIGSLNLVFAGEVDCVTGIPDDGIPQPPSFLELKTRLNTKKHWWIHRDNRKWFMQAYLLGTPNIFMGVRNKNNVLQRTEMIATKDLQIVPFDPLCALRRIQTILEFVIRYLALLPMSKCLLDRGVWRMKVTPEGIKELRLLTPYEVQKLNSGSGEERIGIITERAFNLMRRR